MNREFSQQTARTPENARAPSGFVRAGNQERRASANWPLTRQLTVVRLPSSRETQAPESPIRQPISRRRPTNHETAETAFNYRPAKGDRIQTIEVPSIVATPVNAGNVKTPRTPHSLSTLTPLYKPRVDSGKHCSLIDSAFESELNASF